MLNRIFPRFIVIVLKTQVFVHIQYFWRVISLVHGRVHGRLEGELDVLGQVILEVKVSIPREVFGECQFHFVVSCSSQICCIEITHFEVCECTTHVRIERPRLWEVVEVEFA